MHFEVFHYGRSLIGKRLRLMSFPEYLWQTKQLQLNDRMDLNSYLLKPVQRMGKYALLLTEVSKECPQTHPDYADLTV